MALWKRADCPAPVSTELYPDIDEDDTDAQAAARWCVEQDLMKDFARTNSDGTQTVKFKPYDYVFRPQSLVKWYKLEKLLNRSLFALSGGEKQKIACASADAIHPDIFVLDEPSSNLDIATIEDLIGVIRHWQSEKKTVIVAEHRLYYLVPYADRILYMTHGSITQEFTKAEFQKLLPDELQGMGLRALDPFHLPPEASPKPSAPQLHIKGFQFSYEKHGPSNVDIPRPDPAQREDHRHYRKQRRGKIYLRPVSVRSG